MLQSRDMSKYSNVELLNASKTVQLANEKNAGW